MQCLSKHNTDYQTQPDSRCGSLLKTPVQRKIQIAAKRRDPLPPAATASGILVFRHTGITGCQFPDFIHHMLIGGTYDRQHFDISPGQQRADNIGL